uniref:Uncharacterized protein n=1 Tax=Dunaliella tertiolecta TaxID=3047 RepID=A0A7S3QP22_DUNTE|eukprot:1161148-Pelagomonas_calceolata.AAC.8
MHTHEDRKLYPTLAVRLFTLRALPATTGSSCRGKDDCSACTRMRTDACEILCFCVWHCSYAIAGFAMLPYNVTAGFAMHSKAASPEATFYCVCMALCTDLACRSHLQVSPVGHACISRLQVTHADLACFAS